MENKTRTNTNKPSGWTLTVAQAAQIDAARDALDQDLFRITMENAQAMIDLFDRWSRHKPIKT